MRRGGGIEYYGTSYMSDDTSVVRDGTSIVGDAEVITSRGAGQR